MKHGVGMVLFTRLDVSGCVSFLALVKGFPERCPWFGMLSGLTGERGRSDVTLPEQVWMLDGIIMWLGQIC